MLYCIMSCPTKHYLIYIIDVGTEIVPSFSLDDHSCQYVVDTYMYIDKKQNPLHFIE